MSLLQVLESDRVISPEIRSRILIRSSLAMDRYEIADGIFEELRAASVDPYAVSLEEYKLLLFDAIRASKRPV